MKTPDEIAAIEAEQVRLIRDYLALCPQTRRVLENRAFECARERASYRSVEFEVLTRHILKSRGGWLPQGTPTATIVEVRERARVDYEQTPGRLKPAV